MRIDPRHPETEALWRAVAAAEVRSVAVVSARPGEGCTTVAEALWRRAAAAGRSALLVDLNRDRPGGLRDRLLPPAARGLPAPAVARPDAPSNRRLLTDAGVVTLERRHEAGGALPARDEDGAERADRQGANDRRRALVPGNARRCGEGLGLLVDPGAAAVESWRDPERLREAISGWLRHWDTVVIDTAPVVARSAQGIPGLAAAAAAEATLLVVLAGRTSGTAVREAGQALSKAGARLLGTVLNDRDNPSLRAELERQARRLGRVAPRFAERVVRALHRSSLLGMRV